MDCDHDQYIVGIEFNIKNAFTIQRPYSMLILFPILISKAPSSCFD